MFYSYQERARETLNQAAELLEKASAAGLLTNRNELNRAHNLAEELKAMATPPRNLTGYNLLRELMKLPQDTLTEYDLSVKVEDEYYTVNGFRLVTDHPEDDAAGILEAGSPLLLTLEVKPE